MGSRLQNAWFRPRWRTACGALVLALGLSAPPVSSETPAEDPGTLRVGTSGDYAPFSERDPAGRYSGFSIELARRYAADRGREVEWVRFRWPDLLEALAEDRFDLALSGITVRPERSARGRFSLPLLETGAVAIAKEDAMGGLDGLNRSFVRIGVNAGGHLERVAGERFPHATRVAIPDNAAVLQALQSESVDAVVTDSAEAPRWLAELPEGYAALGPFTRDRKAALVHPSRPELAADFDRWLLEQEQSGALAALRDAHLGPAERPLTAMPVEALLAAVDERLSLMPTVGVVKRRTGVPLEVPEREEVVLEAAAAALLEAAGEGEGAPPNVGLVRAFFRAQMEAAKQVQRDAVAQGFEVAEPLPDLDASLRPGLLRIGDRSALLLLALAGSGAAPGEPPLLARVRDAVRAPYVAPSSLREIASALEALRAVPTPEPEAADATAPNG